MTFGTTFESLRKSWFTYKRDKKQIGFVDTEVCLRILKFQKALGLPLADFPELERYGGSEWVDNELSMMEQGGEDDEGLSPEERKLNQQLRKEELADCGSDEEGEEKEDDDPWYI